jgi:serine/threonine protein kinase
LLESLESAAIDTAPPTGPDEDIAGVDATDLAHPLPHGGDGGDEAIGAYTHAVYYKHGLFSTIYRAANTASSPHYDKHPVVALKVTTPSAMEAPHNSALEAKILSVSQSANVIALLDTFRQPHGRFVLVFPFLPLSFQEYLQHTRFSQVQAKGYIRDLFSALEFIHARGILHRDVKPSNILLEPQGGQAYLADFGISWSPELSQSSEPATKKITDVGTTSYRPPEILFGNTAYGTALDCWAAGCVAAELMTPSRQPLFDSGPLGSELSLINSIFKNLGTPDEKSWPESSTFRDWGKMQFVKFPARSWEEMLPNGSSQGREFVQYLVRYESGTRLKAKDALEHPFFSA